MPVLQIVYETLKDIQELKGINKNNSSNNNKAPAVIAGFNMSFVDRTPSMGMSGLSK